MTKPTEGGFELVVYQIAQLEKAITLLSSQFSSFQKEIETRVQILEEKEREGQFKSRYTIAIASGVGGVVGFIANTLSGFVHLPK